MDQIAISRRQWLRLFGAGSLGMLAGSVLPFGSDGGLLANPVERPAAMLGPGERLDVWVDLEKMTRSTGSGQPRPFDGGGGGAAMPHLFMLFLQNMKSVRFR
jgi:FtsP/CotA-like multicopper oxidase with cupredoxin domain